MTENIFNNANTFILWVVLFSGWCFISAKINKKHGKATEYDERQQQLRLLSFRISFFILIVWSLLGMLLAENGILFCDTATMFFLGILLSFTAFFCINTWKNANDPILHDETADTKAKKEVMLIITGIFWFACVIWVVADYIRHFDNIFTDGKLNGNCRLLFIVFAGLIMIVNALIKQIYCKRCSKKDEDDL